MPVKIGETVHIPAWDLDNGHCVEEYELVEIGATSVKLKHLATYRHQTKLHGSGLTEERPLKYLAYFDVPMIDRIVDQRDFADWLLEQFRVR